jgi:hypothetical protein
MVIYGVSERRELQISFEERKFDVSVAGREQQPGGCTSFTTWTLSKYLYALAPA